MFFGKKNKTGPILNLFVKFRIGYVGSRV
ncbi:hypothetical protein BN2475_150003 [Paraburkholderia ribeironis]|uniref:Uncharacterized protein n=1 Tax=Paraburkholderia ribeironis TaxID=1247936 RepID=A0A1N7RT45_9BURK|nr:hypothetical protein BN2475_150003 [Paraburkholderia ribeironis]